MRIGLRQKLALGLGGLLLIAFAIGIYGLVLLSRLGPAIDVILRENYRSVVAMQEAREALERMDSGALFSLLGFTEGSVRIHEQYDPRFREALRVELGNITLPGEAERAERLHDLYGTYRRTLRSVLDTTRTFEVRRDLYFSTLLPRFGEIKDEAGAILRMNQENMALANEKARRQAAEARRRMYLLLALGVVAAVGFTLYTGRSILRPVRQLTRYAREIERGNLEVVAAVPARDELGRLAEAFNAMVAYLREIRRSDRARLVRTQQAMQIAIDHLPDGVAVLSPQGEVEMANELARRLFHLKPGTKPDPEEYAWLSLLLDEAAAEQAVREERFDLTIQVFDQGDERFFLPQAIPAHDADRLLAGVIYVFADITNLRRAYEARSDLLARLSHELNSPLTSLRMALHLLLEEKDRALHPTQVELLLAAREDADRLNRISTSLRSLARQTPEHEPMHLEAVQPDALLQQAAAPMRKAFEAARLTLHVEAPAALPPVLADHEGIVQMLKNLLENARTYTRPGGEVYLEASSEGAEGVRFSVRDTGIGIPEEHLPHLFDPVYRASEEQQAGLGLAVAQAIAAAHGSRITVKSRKGKGSLFTFMLRRADQADETLSTRHPYRHHPSPEDHTP